MAIDTAAKRRSVAQSGRAPWMGPRVTPDATPDLFWRQCVARVYAGIATGAAVVVAALNYVLFARRRGRR